MSAVGAVPCHPFRQRVNSGEAFGYSERGVRPCRWSRRSPGRTVACGSPTSLEPLMSSVVSPARGRPAGSPRPWTGRPALLGVSLGYFMVLLDMTVLSVAEPDLARSLGGSVAGLQWATTGYTVTFAALLLSAGAAPDRYGAQRLFRSGIAVFAAASLLSAAAPALWVL